jgi:hypothetical protein
MRMRRVNVVTLLFAFAAWAAAQPLAGTYRGATDVGPATVDFAVSGASLSGTLVAPGIAFGFEGQVVDGVGTGVVTTGQGTAGFEAHVRGDLLGLYLYEFDAVGGVAEGTVIELVLERVPAPAAAPALGGLRPATPAAGAPAPIEPGPTAPAPTAPGFTAVAPIAPGPTPATAGDASVLAVGAHARLSEDAALAFLDALEFVLAQIGAPYAFTDAERRAAIDEMARTFPLAEREEQLVLADARLIWERVQENWATATLDDRREFALGVLALAFGEETVAAWVGASGTPEGGGGGGGDGCVTFEDCAGAYIDGQTWSDTFNTQGCWAAAGCSSYDTSTGTFDYD